MGQKTNPTIFRIPYGETWRAHWFHSRHYRRFLREDIAVRRFLEQRLAKAAVERIEMERSPGIYRISIHTARPGMIIGRGGGGIEQLKIEIDQVLRKARIKLPWDRAAEELRPQEVKLQIEEVRKPETRAVLVAKNIVEDLERRLPFRRILRQYIEKVMQSGGVEGVKIMVAGRLDGNEIARTEWLHRGKIPLQTLRAHIDFARSTAHTAYGTIGVKVWIYTGEFFETARDTQER
ncbi:MAG: 30S ribosomal protein S3 [Parcubacteria group bacterium]|nr:30S ribosomal protein S3 [Parcubacteria group bacterium]